MGDRLTGKTVSPNEFGDSKKIAKKAVEVSSAVLDSYEEGNSSTTASVVDEPRFELATPEEVDAAIAKRKDKTQPILDYLKDK